MKKEMNRKGLSDVVTTVLIILFAIVAVAIIGGIVINQVTKAGQKIESATVCADLEITPVKCSNTTSPTDSKVSLVVRRDAGGSSLSVTALNAVFEKADGTTVTTAFITVPAAYATSTSKNTTEATDTITNIKKAGLSATITDASGNKINCDYYKTTKVDCIVA
jgi:flagellin-like protein